MYRSSFSVTSATWSCVLGILTFLLRAEAQISYLSISRFIGGSDTSGVVDTNSTFNGSINTSGTNGSIEVSQQSSCVMGVIGGTFSNHVHGISRNLEYALNEFVVQFSVPTDTSYRLEAWTAGVFTNTVTVTSEALGLGWGLDAVNVPKFMMGCFCVTNIEQFGILKSNATHKLEVHNNIGFECFRTGAGLSFDATIFFGFSLELAPTLSARLTDSGLAIEWPAYGTNFVLERTKTPNLPGTWSTSTNLTEQTNGLLRVKVDANDESHFFRLRGQGN
jgi:hypothetical protein